MIAWLTWLFRAKVEAPPLPPPGNPRQELRQLKLRRRALCDSLSSLRAYGFDAVAGDDELALKTLDRKILALQLKLGSEGGEPLNP
jgi:hypothetical protein